MKAISYIPIAFYIVVLIAAGAIVYYAEQVYNQPQPYVNFTYNSTAQGGVGFVNNTLPYPIEVTSIYCTVPSGTKEVFGSPNNNTLMPGSNTQIMIGVNNRLQPLSKNCTGWKVGYNRLPANTVAPNAPFSVTQNTNT